MGKTHRDKLEGAADVLFIVNCEVTSSHRSRPYCVSFNNVCEWKRKTAQATLLESSYLSACRYFSTPAKCLLMQFHKRSGNSLCVLLCVRHVHISWVSPNAIFHFAGAHTEAEAQQTLYEWELRISCIADALKGKSNGSFFAIESKERETVKVVVSRDLWDERDHKMKYFLFRLGLCLRLTTTHTWNWMRRDILHFVQ